MKFVRSFTAVLIIVVMAGATPAVGQGLTKEQGDAMLQELKQIRQLLEKQQRPSAPVAPPSVPEKVKLKLGSEYSLGREDAPVVMVEYTDYQCSFCNRFSTGTFPEIKKKLIDTGKVRFVTRDFPLDFHPQAMRAAQASRCAGEQGKFWPMKESLISNSSRLTSDLITSLARENGLDISRFQACLDEGKYQEQIRSAMAAGKAVGINGTPSFVIGRMNGDTLEGTVLVGAQPFAAFESAVQQFLQEK